MSEILSNDVPDQAELTAEQIQAITNEYNSSVSKHTSLLEEVKFILSDRLESKEIKVHQIEARLKELPSVVAKCKRDSLADFSKLDDVVGSRVICLFRPDMDQVGQVIAENFEVLKIDDKLSNDNNPLGYLSVHYSCKIPSHYVGPRYENTGGIVFEIQVRTLCMHCWAAVSHYLDYKGDWDVPADLKRALSALAGLFYVADNEFDQFYAARAASRKKAEAEIGPKSGQEINLDTMIAYLKSKFPERQAADSEAVSDLVREVKLAGYQSLEEVDANVLRGLDALERYEEKFAPVSGEFNPVGVVRLVLTLVDENFRKVRMEAGKIRLTDSLFKFSRFVK